MILILLNCHFKRRGTVVPLLFLICWGEAPNRVSEKTAEGERGARGEAPKKTASAKNRVSEKTPKAKKPAERKGGQGGKGQSPKSPKAKRGAKRGARGEATTDRVSNRQHLEGRAFDLVSVSKYESFSCN